MGFFLRDHERVSTSDPCVVRIFSHREDAVSRTLAEMRRHLDGLDVYGPRAVNPAEYGGWTVAGMAIGTGVRAWSVRELRGQLSYIGVPNSDTATASGLVNRVRVEQLQARDRDADDIIRETPLGDVLQGVGETLAAGGSLVRSAGTAARGTADIAAQTAGALASTARASDALGGVLGFVALALAAWLGWKYVEGKVS